MYAFATVAELQARWRALTTDEQAKASALLTDASALIARQLGEAGIDYASSSDPFASALVAVTCNVVRRAMATGTDSAALTQTSQTAGPYSQSFTFANPSGDVYLTSFERKSLGLGRSRVGQVRAHIRTEDGGEADGW